MSLERALAVHNTARQRERFTSMRSFVQAEGHPTDYGTLVVARPRLNRRGAAYRLEYYPPKAGIDTLLLAQNTTYELPDELRLSEIWSGGVTKNYAGNLAALAWEDAFIIEGGESMPTNLDGPFDLTIPSSHVPLAVNSMLDQMENVLWGRRTRVDWQGVNAHWNQGMMPTVNALGIYMPEAIRGAVPNRS